MTVLGVTEHRRGDVRDVSFEMVTAGRRLADDLGTDLALAVIGGDIVGEALDVAADDCQREVGAEVVG